MKIVPKKLGLNAILEKRGGVLRLLRENFFLTLRRTSKQQDLSMTLLLQPHQGRLRKW